MSANSPEVRCWAHVAAQTNSKLYIEQVFKGPRDKRRPYGLPSLTAEVEGVSIHGEVSGEGDPPATFAQLSTRVPGSQGLRLRVYRNYVYPQFGRVVGIQGLVIGDPHFDRSFVVKSTDPGYARIWLSPRARNLMLSAPDYCFEIDHERAIATSHRADDPAQLEAAIHVLAALARRGHELNEEIRRLAGRLGGEAEVGEKPWLSAPLDPNIEFTSGGRKVNLSIGYGGTGKRGHQRLLTRLWCRRISSRSDRFVFLADNMGRKERPKLASRLAKAELGTMHPQGYHLHASSIERLRKHISERHARSLVRLRPLVVSCSEAVVELIWPGAILRENTLREAAELCEYFAVDSQGALPSGPYR